MTAAIYLRKSRAEETSDPVSETLKRHRETLLAYSAEKNITVFKIYEEVVSGGSLYSRPEMLHLLSDAEQKNFDAVLCMDIDRLGRGSMSEQGIILETLKRNGIKIITPRKTYDLSNEIDEEYTEFESFMARRELKIIKRRMQRGVIKTVEEGGYLSNPPYGYEKTVLQKRPSLKINEAEARFVRLIFDLYGNHGLGCQEISRIINEMGAKPHRSNFFCRTSIRKILKNSVYIGKTVWRQSGSEENKMEVPGLHPAIIDAALFYRVQDIFKNRHHSSAPSGEIQNTLAGLVRCGKCGSLMQRQILKGYSNGYLVCLKNSCMVSSPLENVENRIVFLLERMSNSFSIVFSEESNDSDPDKIDVSETIRKKQQKIHAQIDRLYELLERGVYDEETYRSRKKKLSKQELQLERLLQQLKNDPEGVSASGSEASINLIDCYRSATNSQKNQILKALIRTITYRKEKNTGPDGFHLDIVLRDFSQEEHSSSLQES